MSPPKEPAFPNVDRFDDVANQIQAVVIDRF
jgi:hypothetical protein